MTEIKISDIVEYMNYCCKLNIFLLNYIKDHKLIGSIGPRYEYDNSKGYGYNLVEYDTLYVYGYVPNLNISEVSGIHNLFIRTNDAVHLASRHLKRNITDRVNATEAYGNVIGSQQRQ